MLADPPLSIFASLAAGNLTVAILIRQEYVINTLYKSLWLVPLNWSLKVCLQSHHHLRFNRGDLSSAYFLFFSTAKLC